MRGFIIFFTPFNANYLDPSCIEMCATLGENEECVVDEFRSTFSGQRRLIGVVCLEEIEHHRALILRCAAEQGLEIDRLPGTDWS